MADTPGGYFSAAFGELNAAQNVFDSSFGSIPYPPQFGQEAPDAAQYRPQQDLSAQPGNFQAGRDATQQELSPVSPGPAAKNEPGTSSSLPKAPVQAPMDQLPMPEFSDNSLVTEAIRRMKYESPLSSYPKRHNGQITPPDEGEMTTSRQPLVHSVVRRPSTSRKRKSISVETDGSEHGEYSMDGEDDDPKRKKFLERNRIAASKCRQKKKKWTQELEYRARIGSQQTKNLQMVIGQLKDELLVLKTELLKHQGCNCAGVRDYMANESNDFTSLIPTFPPRDQDPFEASCPQEMKPLPLPHPID